MGANIQKRSVPVVRLNDNLFHALREAGTKHRGKHFKGHPPKKERNRKGR